MKFGLGQEKEEILQLLGRKDSSLGGGGRNRGLFSLASLSIFTPSSGPSCQTPPPPPPSPSPSLSSPGTFVCACGVCVCVCDICLCGRVGLQSCRILAALCSPGVRIYVCLPRRKRARPRGGSLSASQVLLPGAQRLLHLQLLSLSLSHSFRRLT